MKFFKIKMVNFYIAFFFFNFPFFLAFAQPNKDLQKEEKLKKLLELDPKDGFSFPKMEIITSCDYFLENYKGLPLSKIKRLHYLRGFSLLVMGEPKLALKDFEKLKVLNKNDFESNYWIARSFLDLGHYEKAEKKRV